MTTRRSVSDVLSRLAESEDRFLANEFLAPALRGHRVRVRIADVICEMRIEPKSFEGWGVFQTQSHSVARLVRDATLRERRQYLDCLPRVRMVLCQHLEGWFAIPAEKDSRMHIEGTPPVCLVESGELFQTIWTRFDGATFWFDSLETRQDPTIASWLRDCLADEAPPNELKRSGLTSALRHAYAMELQRRRNVMRVERHDQIETQLRNALSHSGARLHGFVEHADGYRVTWTAGGRRHVSSVDRDSLTVQVAGICLSGEDQKFDLGSLAGVVQEAERSHEVIEVGHENGGMTEDDYFRIHPRRQ